MYIYFTFVSFSVFLSLVYLIWKIWVSVACITSRRGGSHQVGSGARARARAPPNFKVMCKSAHFAWLTFVCPSERYQLYVNEYSETFRGIRAFRLLRGFKTNFQEALAAACDIRAIRTALGGNTGQVEMFHCRDTPGQS